MAVGVASSTSPTPPAQSWDALRSKVANAVGFGGDPEVLGLAGEGINNGARYLNSRMWSWLLTTEDLTFVADQADYTLAANFHAPRSAELLDSSGNAKSRLYWEDPKTFSDLFLDRSVSGEPRVYTVFSFYDNGKLTLSSPASTAFLTKYPTLRLRYYKHLQTYSSGGSSMKIPPESELFLEMYAKWEVSATLRPQLTGTYERMWRSQEVAMLRAESHRFVKDFS